MSSFDLKFEEAAVLFNLGAVYSQLAASEAVSTSEGLKRACRYFTLAAGVFERVGEQTGGLDLPAGSDVLPSAVQVIQEMMLAQAQECFVLKAILDRNVKDLTLAKLAASTAAMFEAALKNSAGSTGGLFAEYQDLLAAKAAYYRAMAHYRRSGDFLIASQYGREVVKLQEAEESIKIAKELLKRLPPDLVSQINALDVTIEQNLRRATKDNSLVYNDPIPHRGSWGDCGSAVVVKPAPFPEASLEAALSAPFLFDRLPEIHISRLVQELHQRRAELLADYSSRLEGTFEALEGLFPRLGLPGVVQALMVPEGLPEQVKQQAAAIKLAGGYEGLEAEREKVQSLRTRCREELSGIASMMDEEERLDLEARSKYLSRWIRPTSAQLNHLLRQRIADLQRTMVEGQSVDASLEQLFDRHIPTIIMLCYDEAELEAVIPPSRGGSSEASVSADSPLGALVEEISLAMARREDLRDERTAMLAALQEVASSFDVIDKVYRHKDDPQASGVIAGELSEALASVDQASLQTKVEEYCRLMERLVADLNSHLQDSARNTGQRQETLQSLSEATEAFKAIRLQLGSATEFYTGLLEHITKLHQVCAPFVANRRSEYASLTQALEASTSPAALAPTLPVGEASSPPSGYTGYPSAAVPGAWNPAMPIRYAGAAGGSVPGMPQNVSPVNYHPGMIGYPAQYAPYPPQYAQPTPYAQYQQYAPAYPPQYAQSYSSMGPSATIPFPAGSPPPPPPTNSPPGPGSSSASYGRH